MKIKIAIILLSLFFQQNIYTQEVNEKEESKVPVNHYGQPFVRGPITPDVGYIKPLDLDYANFEPNEKKELTRDERMENLNKQVNPNEVKPDKKYLKDVEDDLKRTNNNENGISNQNVIVIIVVISIIVLIFGIFIMANNNNNNNTLMSDIVVTKVIDSSKILAELEKLQSLRQSGVITEEEFENLKKKILINS